MFFASRGMKNTVISDVVRHKTGNFRDEDAVDDMIRRICREVVGAGYGDPFDEYTRQLDPTSVDLSSMDRWLLRQLPTLGARGTT